MTKVTDDLEQAIVDLGADVAPRITPSHIEDTIKDCYFINAGEALGLATVSSPLNLLTICTLVLKNGFTVTGESACASPENFNAQIGQEIAFNNAKEKVWLLEGYLLKQKLSEA